MNGFVNTILSLMLSWIRALISNLWALLTSEDGGAFCQFFSAHWLTIVAGLCVACMLVDMIVYFFRWRPDYVWASKWRRLRRGRSRRSAQPPAPEAPQPQEAFCAYQPEPAPDPQPAAPTAAYAPFTPSTMVYAPATQATQAWQPAQELEEPVFDDAALWESDVPLEADWQMDEEEPAYGAPQPEPLAYFRDVQAGFAPAVPPEQLYQPSRSYQPPVQEPDETPVHPGLDEETFRQSVGLEEAPEPRTPVMRAPVFRPYTVTAEPRPDPQSQGAFQRFAQRARDFMAMDETERKTIRDLQSNVDVSKAFHEPVYPQSFDQDEE